MSVGEALAEARGAAGLSVDDVSDRTAIREIVIRSIERDDFDSLGGDLYVRGYLRKIAGAVGIDPRPLIREFDATRSNGSGGWPALGTPGSTAAAAGPAPESVAAPAVPDPVVPDPVGDSVQDLPAGERGEVAGEPEARFDAASSEMSDAAVEPVPVMEPLSAAGPGTETKPEPAAEPTGTGGDARDDETDAEPYADAEFAGTEPPPEVAQADDPDAEQYWSAAGAAGAATSDQSWSDQGWTEPVAADAVWADMVPLESAGTSAGATGEPASATGWGVPAAAARTGQSAAASPAAAATRAAPAPAKPRRPQPRTRVRGWRWVATISGVTILVLAIVGVATGEIVSKLGSTKSAAAAPRSVPATGPASTAPPATPAAVASTPAAVATTPASKPTPTSSARPVAPVRLLAVEADGAYGPDGLADGDNPQSASFAITAGSPAPWQTDWYTTADFGLLKHGTGLLLDMGKRVTITSVTIKLGDDWGADLQVRAGDEADLSEMPVVASATSAGGQLTLQLKSPARARYVLIWFVKLPPSGSGTYMASIYSVRIEGRP